MNQVAIILPAFNEASTIAATIKDFNCHLPKAAIWVINNRSSDTTEACARETVMSLGCSGGVINEYRPGKGNAIRRAFTDVDADFYLMADADLTYPADQAEELLNFLISGNFDMVVGDRLGNGCYEKENKRHFHSFGNKLVRFLVNQLFGSNLNDIMSGYRVFSKRFVKNYAVLVEGFELETDITLFALDKRFRIAERPIIYKDRPEGSFSKLNTFKDGFKVIKTIFDILRYFRPLFFFSVLSFSFFCFGLLAGLPVIVEWIETGIILRLPLAILAVGLEVLSVLLLGIGLILDSIVHANRESFERGLVKGI